MIGEGERGRRRERETEGGAVGETIRESEVKRIRLRPERVAARERGTTRKRERQ